MILETLAGSQTIENLGWTLLHSVWQIAAVGFWLFLMLRVSARSSANPRYLISLFALSLALILPLTTFVWLSQNSSNANRNFINADTENPAIFNEKIQPPENFPLQKSAETTKSNEKDFFVSVENLQSDFAEKFAGAAPFLVVFWFLGIAFFAVRLFGGVWQLHVYKTRKTFLPVEEWQEIFSDLCERLKITQNVRLAQSKIVETPMVIGWLKPVVLVPASVFLNMHPAELETILAHELVHIRRHDYFVNFAQSFVEILFFYHPATWWISAQIRRERECACDDEVVKTLENSLIVYANALANLEEFRLRARATKSPVLVAATGGKLMKRIERIIKNKNAKTGIFQTSLWSASLVSALILALVLGLFSQATDLSVNAQMKFNNNDKKIAVGFVSIPPNYRADSDVSFDETARLLIEKLTARRVPAVGFVNGGSISPDEILQEQLNRMFESINNAENLLIESRSNPDNLVRVKILIEKFKAQQSEINKMISGRANVVRMWRDAGLEVGIGGFRHIWFYDTPYDEYVANTEKNERVVRQILAEKNLPLKYFSYPFLNTGKTAQDKIQFENWLANQNLKSVKYTFDNSEWMYSFAYDMARKDNDANRMKEIRADYLDYMTRMTEHYEAYSREMFGRDIAQTLVLTPSRLVTDTADEFFGTLEKRGYKFVSMDEAQSDEAYQAKEAHVAGKSGVSWFERWQRASGKNLRDEPKVSESVERIWENTDKNLPPPPPAPPRIKSL